MLCIQVGEDRSVAVWLSTGLQIPGEDGASAGREDVFIVCADKFNSVPPLAERQQALSVLQGKASGRAH